MNIYLKEKVQQYFHSKNNKPESIVQQIIHLIKQLYYKYF